MSSSKFRLVLVRTAESEWYKKGLFCGWINTLLTQKGCEQAAQTGELLRRYNFEFDIAQTSILARAQATLHTLLWTLEQPKYAIIQKSWRLNEKHYGAMTGYSRADLVKRFGEEQVDIWVKSFSVPPPKMEFYHPYYTTIVKNPMIDYVCQGRIPSAESLEMVMKRMEPYWTKTIVPEIQSGQRLLIVAHENILRAIVKILDDVPDSAIGDYEIPISKPIIYNLNEHLQPIEGGSFQLLEDSKEDVQKAY